MRKTWILTLALTTITLNQGTNSRRPKISYAKHGLFTKSEFTKYRKIINLGFEALTMMVIRSFIYWDITPRNLLKVNHLLSYWFLASLILQPWRRRHVPLKRQSTFDGLRSDISQRQNSSYNKLFALGHQIWEHKIGISLYMHMRQHDHI